MATACCAERLDQHDHGPEGLRISGKLGRKYQNTRAIIARDDALPARNAV
jgi:hypothetical protein